MDKRFPRPAQNSRLPREEDSKASPTNNHLAAHFGTDDHLEDKRHLQYKESRINLSKIPVPPTSAVPTLSGHQYLNWYSPERRLSKSEEKRLACGNHCHLPIHPGQISLVT
jgi:hypothetical protein